ncbi:ecotropic viral integration site [Reticulomyxa filosa]|uniref:Ecotropic viral integration site n=1 Tax=Reticulomyxa filosa TaxID=46433 RepID=X6MY71_RETFI|nr:ecotropic viral integration site [Reticulomyxa filosa]|eukprot:ETO18581.1 ecotropic viral integration site [Reticulomyxa filosa]
MHIQSNKTNNNNNNKRRGLKMSEEKKKKKLLKFTKNKYTYTYTYMYICICSEEEAFWMFVTVLCDKKYYARSLFIPELPGYVRCEKALNQLLECHLPRLHKYFESMECLRAMLSPWLHCLFAYPNIDTNITLYIWDLFLIKDFSIFLRVAFMICLVHVEKFMQLTLSKLSSFASPNSF